MKHLIKLKPETKEAAEALLEVLQQPDTPNPFIMRLIITQNNIKDFIDGKTDCIKEVELRERDTTTDND